MLKLVIQLHDNFLRRVMLNILFLVINLLSIPGNFYLMYPITYWKPVRMKAAFSK